MAAGPLAITSSADLSLDKRFDVIVNSVSPEFASSSSDSGINLAVWRTLTGYSGEGDKPPAVRYDTSAFAAANGARPTYGDVLWSDVPEGRAPEGSALRYIVHALAPDRSNRPKRLPSGLSKEEAFACLVAVYFRVLWQATAKGGAGCSIGMPPLGAGVFANDAADVQRACALAHAAYCATGGTASVSVALWSPDGSEPKDTGEWRAAAAAAPAPAALGAALRDALAPGGGPLLLSRVPAAHTTDELTELLEKSADPKAAEFLAIRADKEQAKALKAQMADGTWAPLLSSLGESVAAPPPFAYEACPAMDAGEPALLGFLRSQAFLHFELPCAAEPEPEPSS